MRSKVPSESSLERSFPAAMLSAVGTKESWRKEVNRPATSTHKWWAKRLGSVFRGIIVSAVTQREGDPAGSYASNFDLDGMTVLDPFSGSGITGVEVLKLGGKPVCFDINPVATLVQRQAIQPWDIHRLEATYKQVENKCREAVESYYRTEDGRTVLYYFWVARTRCPECGEGVRLFDSTVFSKNAYPKRVPKAQVVCPVCLDILESRYDFREEVCSNGHIIDPRGAVRGQSCTCPQGHTFKTVSALNDEPPQFEMYAKMVLSPSGGKQYEPITDWDRALYEKCGTELAALPSSFVLPEGVLEPGNNTNQALRWNFREWRDFFNARQLLCLSILATAIRDIPGYSAEREALAALFSGTLEFNNMFASFKGEGTGAVRHMFSHHVLKPERTPLEANPWGTPQSSGSFSTLYRSRILRAYEYKTTPFDLVANKNDDDVVVERVQGISRSVSADIVDSWQEFVEAAKPVAYVATKNSAMTDIPDGMIDLVITDPPYMDNVYYAELADFFHAWLRGITPYEGYADVETTRSQGEVQNDDPQKFGDAIESVWAECARVLKPGGLLAFTFHQARISGWVQVVSSLFRAGFVVTSVQPVKGEMSTSVVKKGAKEPSNLDSVVVCRRLEDGAVAPGTCFGDALAGAREAIGNLIQSNTDVGSGDVRSVVRGTLIAHLVACGGSLDDDVLQSVDDAADEMIKDLLV